MFQKCRPNEYKFILLGDSNVGKSSIFKRLSGSGFSESHIATIGIDSKIINFNDIQVDKKTHHNFKIVLYDTAGQERYKSISKVYFRDSQGIVLIYNITDEVSFGHIQVWLDSIKESLSDWKRSGYIVMLLGNKLDIAEENMKERKVLKEEAEKICNEQGIYWGGECSAKTFDESQIKKIFEKFVIQIFLKFGNDDNKKRQVLKVAIKSKKPRKSCVAKCGIGEE